MQHEHQQVQGMFQLTLETLQRSHSLMLRVEAHERKSQLTLQHAQNIFAVVLGNNNNQAENSGENFSGGVEGGGPQEQGVEEDSIEQQLESEEDSIEQQLESEEDSIEQQLENVGEDVDGGGEGPVVMNWEGWRRPRSVNMIYPRRSRRLAAVNRFPLLKGFTTLLKGGRK